MSKEEYANYDYQTTAVPLKTEYGVTIGTETKSTYKLCTNDCVYKNNWNELKEIIEQDIRQCEELIEMCPKELKNTIIGTRSYEEIIGCNKYILSKMQELENRKV